MASAEVWIRRRWLAYVRSNRLELSISRCELATRAGVDPALITLIERDGHIPRRHNVRALGKVFGDVARTELAAGYLPAAEEKRESDRLWRGCLAVVAK